MNRFGRGDKNSVVANELNAVFVDGELLSISACCDNDPISVRGRVDGVLNAFAGIDVNCAAVTEVVPIAVFPAVALVFGVLVLAATPNFPLAFAIVPGYRC